VGLTFSVFGCTAADSENSALGEQIQRLEARKTRIEDSNDIKRLQRAYGYYVDEALWDEVADLFSDDGSVEYGLDGVYVGKDRVREYLYALGNGQSGLSEGQLNDHLQLMPIVTVASDGMSAQGRWRGLILSGTLGESAVWGEGPYENVYVKEDGVWKIQDLHWYQSIIVPYEGGWQVNEDPTGGKFVSGTLPPDRPPSVEYEIWPSTYLPPFHFPNPVLGAGPASALQVSGEIGDASLEALAGRAGVLTQELQLLEDENEIENLQRIYGFYTDKQLWTDAANLFADDATIEVGGSGVYTGRDRVLAYLSTYGTEGPQDNRLFDQMQLQPIVHVAPDGQTAQARWHMFAQEAVSGEYDEWGLGIYENGYVKQDGVWKIQNLHQYTTMYSPYAEGWGKVALPMDGPSETLPPDLPPTAEYESYPAVFIAPYHYENPVTGAPVYTESPDQFAPPIAADARDLEVALTALDGRMTRLEDADAIERLNATYGYYLARNQWDDLAGLWSPEVGTIEIAMRGVYVGPESVRRNLNLYGEAGIHEGLLHNHMQYQPVIHISADGQTANMRSRAFSIMGEFGIYSMWMGGIYENDFVKEGGIWKIRKDQVFNSYFVQYATGWKDTALRPPPGITDANPPDLPPSMPFEMYPKAFLPPFHYPHPVTGNQ